MSLADDVQPDGVEEYLADLMDDRIQPEPAADGDLGLPTPGSHEGLVSAWLTVAVHGRDEADDRQNHDEADLSGPPRERGRVLPEGHVPAAEDGGCHAHDDYRYGDDEPHADGSRSWLSDHSITAAQRLSRGRGPRQAGEVR